jgi:hypothetical protein
MLGKSLINQVPKHLSTLRIVAVAQVNYLLNVTPQMQQTFLLSFDWVAFVGSELITADNTVKLRP